MQNEKSFMLWKDGEATTVTTARAKSVWRYDVCALFVIITVTSLDLWTKSLVVAHLSPPNGSNKVSLIPPYLVLEYRQNSGAAFSSLQNSFVLVILILAALLVVGYIYFRILNKGPLYYKIVFGLVIGGALGNVIDRIHNGGYVVDFIFFRIPQLHFKFAVFNIADASLSIGIILVFILLFFVRPAHYAKYLKNRPNESA